MNRSPMRLLATVLIASSLAACGPYRYMHDTTPELDVSRNEYVTNNPGNRYNDDILDGRVRPGMSRLQVRVTWGDPDQVAPRPPATEYWSYQEDDVASGFAVYELRFDGEILSDIDIDRSANLSSNDEESQSAERKEDSSVQPESGRKPAPR